MDFIKPIYLWSALAIAIPILIHLWHQKKGQVMAWAAMQWLTEKEQQQHRGLQLENVWLLLVRCLLVLLLALLLSQPVLNWLRGRQTTAVIHLVQPNAFLVNSYRFELENALKNGQQVVWATPSADPVENISQLPGQQSYTPVALQAAINTIRQQNAGKHSVELHLYLLNNQLLASIPFVQVPATYKLHTAVDSLNQPVRPYITTRASKLFVNKANTLTNSPTLATDVRFSAEPVRSGRLRVLVTYQNKAEQQAVSAALNALAEVYSLDLAIDLQPTGDKAYDWVLTDQAVDKPLPTTFYVISGTSQIATTRNMYYTQEPLTIQTADRVSGGQLPEWLGELFIQQLGLQPTRLPLTKQQLSTLFVPYTPKEGKEQEQTHRYFVLLFVGLVGLERWLALRKNA